MILVTCVVGSWIAEKSARAIALQEAVQVATDETVSQRILVPVANQATIDALMDLAVMIREPHSLEPIHVLSVIPCDGNMQAQIVSHEKQLVPAVERAAASDVPVRITIRVDTSPVSGIVRALTEIVISQVIIGWTGERTTRERIFGTVLDQVLAYSSQMVLVCKLMQPLNTMRRVVMVVPPNADREPHFGELLHTVKTLSREIAAPVCLLAPEENVEALKQSVALTKPAIPTTFQTYPQWSEFMNYLPKMNGDDLIVLVSAREHTISWCAELNSAPGQVAADFPHISLLIVYPALLLRREVPAWSEEASLLQCIVDHTRPLAV